MDYVELRPSTALAPYVRCYWNLRSAAGVQTMFPDGRMELVFHFGAPVWDGRSGERRGRAIVAGQMVEPVIVRASGDVDVFGIRLQPAAPGALLGVFAPELAGSVVEAGYRELAERLEEEPTPSRRAALADSWLLGRALGPIDPLTAHCAQELARGSRLDRLGLSERQVRRRFVQAVGISPKLFARIARFQRALGACQRLPLVEAAIEAGFADQAHLTREFGQFAGVTPAQWLAQHVRILQDTSEPLFRD